MLYRFIKYLTRCTLPLFFRKITVNDADYLKMGGPLLLACNHPNSFLDAIVIGALFKRPVHFLARGDAFRRPFVRAILTRLKMIPIYRLSEGREQLALNDATFNHCREILSNGGIVLIFSEGLCLHQWGLRTLKKGTARIAIDAWLGPVRGEVLKVLPVSLNYNSFDRFGKQLIVHFASPLHADTADGNRAAGENIVAFNQLLSLKLQQGLLAAQSDDGWIPFLLSNYAGMRWRNDQLIATLQLKQQEIIEKKMELPLQWLRLPCYFAESGRNAIMRLVFLIFFAVPALAGWLLHMPLYLPVKNLVKGKTTGTVFYDSVLFGMLMILYPFYIFVSWLISSFFFSSAWSLLLPLLMPLLAWLLLLYKCSAQAVLNFFRMPYSVRQAVGRIFNQ